MKKQLLKLSVAVVALLFAGQLMAQMTYDCNYVTTPPSIDGAVDDLWTDVTKSEIVVPYTGETVSFTTPAYFQAVWDDNNIYVLVTVDDDNFYSSVESGGNSWQADKPEVYLDVNEVRIADAPVGPSTAESGHFQVAPGFDETAGGPCENWAFDNSSGAKYICEYEISIANLLDIDGNVLDPRVHATIGWDLTIIDLDAPGAGGNDPTMGRINWANDMSTTGESWGDMDGAGDLTFVGAPSAIREYINSNVVILPNVTNEFFAVNVDATNVTLVNSIGQVVKNVTSNFDKIDVSDLATGMYFVTVSDVEGSVYVNKLLVK